MICCSALPGAAVGCQARLTTVGSQSSGALKILTGAELHPEHFTYRPSQRKAPSLRRGWILGRNRDTPDSGLEVLVVRPDQEEEQKEKESSQISQWKNLGGGDVLFDGNGFSMEGISNGQRYGCLLEEDPEGDGRRQFLTKPKYVRGPTIDKKSFIRVYYVSALRVPASESWDLAYKLRNHLLNWPRMSNIGRVAGDDVDEDLANLFVETAVRKPSLAGHALRAAVYEDSGTRPSRKKQAAKTNGKGSSKQEIPTTMLELVGADCVDKQQDDTPSGCVPHPLRSQKWTGPTRLLLLDEEHAGKVVSELPLDLQTVCSTFRHHAPTSSGSGLEYCRLTLFYEYWSMEEVLRELLPTGAHMPVKFKRTGHVAELKLHPAHIPFRDVIAQVALDKHEPTVRSVVVKREILHSREYAVQLELLAGTSSLVTTAWEYGIPFQVDLASVIYDAGLSSERRRLVGLFSKYDVVCDVCAGVGLVAIPASKKVRRVFANDVNPNAYNYLARNVVENEVSGRVEIFNEDIRTFLSHIFTLGRPVPITQLVMSHPLDAADFLEFFQGAFERRTWPNRSLPQIHLYGISRATDPEEDFAEQIAEALQTATVKMSTNRVAEVSTGEWMVCASFVLPAHVGFHEYGQQIY